MKEFYKINILIGFISGTLFTVLASVVFEITELKKLFLIVIVTVIATVTSVLFHVFKAIYEMAKEEPTKKN